MPTIPTSSTAAVPKSTPARRPPGARAATSGSPAQSIGASTPVAAKATSKSSAGTTPSRGGRTPESETLPMTQDRRIALVQARTSGANTAALLAEALRKHPAFAGVEHLITPQRISGKVRAMVVKLTAEGKDKAASRLALRRSVGSWDLDEIEGLLLAGEAAESSAGGTEDGDLLDSPLVLRGDDLDEE